MDFKIDLIYKNKPVLGLDIGSTSLKVVQLKKRNGKNFLVGCGIRELTEGIFNEDGTLVDPVKTAKEIKSLINNPKWGKITAKRLNLSIPESRIFTRVLEVPVMSEKEQKDAVLWEAEQYIPIPKQELYIDWVVTDTFQRDKNILNELFIVAAPKKIVDSYLEVIKALKGEPFSIELNLAAVTRSLVSNKAKDEAAIMLDFGGTLSSIAVFDHDIRVTGTIPVGAKNIAVSDPGDKKQKFENLNVVTAEIKKLISYYEEKKKENGKKITKIIICGGCAYRDGLGKAISDLLKLHVEVGNPWINISTYPLKPVSKIDSPRYANAIGLALKGVQNE